MLEIVEPDAVERARHDWQFDLYLRKRIGVGGALPFPEWIATDADHAVGFNNTPGGFSVRGELQPAHRWYFLFCRHLRRSFPGARGGPRQAEIFAQGFARVLLMKKSAP